jgi:S1-C subfamily serine protease
MSFPSDPRYSYRPPAPTPGYSYVPAPPAAPKGPPGGSPIALAVLVSLLVGGLSGGLFGFVAGKSAAGRSGSVTSSFFGADLASPARSQPPEGSVAAIVESIKPSVVAIYTEAQRSDSFFRAVPDQGAGSGMILDREGHVLTNAHVVAGATKIAVALSDGRRVDGTVVGSYPAGDLAVVKISAGDLTPVTLGNSDQLRAGDRVIAVGNALALRGGPTVTGGIVSAVDRTIQVDTDVVLESLVQTDAAINPGNSGGPLLDAEGKVVGVNTAIASQAQSIGFAISIAQARPSVEQLIRTGKVVRPLLGVLLTDVPVAADKPSVAEGAVVATVQPKSPALAAGIEEGDVIVEVDGRAVKDAQTAKRAIGTHRPGDKLQLTVVRGTERLTITATLGQQ